MEVGGGGGGGVEMEKEIYDAYIRCEKGTEEGTMGFFVAGLCGMRVVGKKVDGWREWNGFSDDMEATVVERDRSSISAT